MKGSPDTWNFSKEGKKNFEKIKKSETCKGCDNHSCIVHHWYPMKRSSDYRIWVLWPQGQDINWRHPCGYKYLPLPWLWKGQTDIDSWEQTDNCWVFWSRYLTRKYNPDWAADLTGVFPYLRECRSHPDLRFSQKLRNYPVTDWNPFPPQKICYYPYLETGLAIRNVSTRKGSCTYVASNLASYVAT